MRVLLTNDDGIRAPGLKALVDLRPPDVELWVMAPDRERSATGHAITVHKPLFVDAVDMGQDVRAFQVNGTPSDCVKLGMELFGERPDVVISGINRGPNLGTDVMYSGTVSGAIEAAVGGVPALAVSLDSHSAWAPQDYRVASQIAWYVARKLDEHGLPAGTLLNVNVPAGSEIRGFMVTRLGIRRYRDVLHRRVDPRGRVYYWMAGEAEDVDVDDATDAGAVRSGYVSITPMEFDLTKHAAVETVRSWGLDLPDLRAPGGERA
ncbi:MAG: 5'/3'-nucleotidase SurE [Firmicutes bacterium]|nr:5'/3'-nucleotidase SurE [Bacillota bacterium]